MRKKVSDAIAGLALSGLLPFPVVGAEATVTVPTVLSARLVLRPSPWFRVAVGPSTNMVSAGVHAGATLAVPASARFFPAVSVDGGWQARGDLGHMAQLLGARGWRYPFLESVSYSHVGGSVGADVGRPDRWYVSLRLGASCMWFRTRGLERYLLSITPPSVDVKSSEASVRACSPTFQVGVGGFF